MKRLKTFLATIVMLVLAFTFTACAATPQTPDAGDNGSNITGDNVNQNGSDSGSGNEDSSAGGSESNDNNNESQTPEAPSGSDENGGNDHNPPVTTTSDILIAYFSCTNTTEAIAQHIEAETKGTLSEIVPQVPYTEDDLKYYTNCRADREQADSTARPAINGSVENIEKYDVVFVGYPIWHGQAPKIIYTFLESYDFSGKTIIPFCTSASSGIGNSDKNLHALAPSAEWISGKRFSAGTSQNTVADWIKTLDLKLAPDGSATPPEKEPVKEEITKMYLTINGNKLEVTLAENSSVDALVEILKQGDITFTADENGNFEMYGDIGHSLPTNNTQISAQAGDVILYAGRYLCLFFGSNTYSYTKIGRIDGYSASELRTLLGAAQGSVQVTVSLK